MALIKQDLDTWLDNVSYRHLNSRKYEPSMFALNFMNFIKLVNGTEGESHLTPPFHLSMLDKIPNDNPYVANLCFRGASKTSLFIEYLSLYLATFNHLPNLGDLSGMIYISDSMENGVKSARKNIEFRYNNSEFMQHWVPEAKFTDANIEFSNRNNQVFGIKLFGAKSGIRGSKLYGKRPQLAVLDDLVSDADANSEASMSAIKDTVYKGINHALDPNTRKILFNGTPFNKYDVLVEAVESGAWDVNVWPVCEEFPCSKEDFRGAWPDRFPYEFVKEQYDLALNTGKLASFNQELMLRITSEDDRLVQNHEIQWYDKANLLANKGNFNFYITTDFATSEKQKSDFSVISVWAYSANGDWFWVDGICVRQTMDKSINDLFRFASMYKPQQVGVETSGQQGAFIQWLQNEMITRNIWFNFASSSKNGEPGIRPVSNKLQRFNLVVPWFKMGKIHFPRDMRTSNIMGEAMQEIRLATFSGLKGKDDFIDTISMLGYLKPWKPSDSIPEKSVSSELWEDDEQEDPDYTSSYIV